MDVLPFLQAHASQIGAALLIGAGLWSVKGSLGTAWEKAMARLKPTPAAPAEPTVDRDEKAYRAVHELLAYFKADPEGAAAARKCGERLFAVPVEPSK